MKADLNDVGTTPCCNNKWFRNGASSILLKSQKPALYYYIRYCWLRETKGIQPVKNWVFVGGIDFTGAFARLIVLVVNTAIILSSSKIQNGDILVPANPGPPG